ncbi:MAG: HD domain-containing phosphohydrolase [bacterium]
MNEREKIELITQISLDINKVKDLDILLERILTNVRRFFNADAGSIYLKQGDKLKFSYTQNDTLANRMGPNKKLLYTTFSIPIDNDSIAGYVARNQQILNIPDVYVLSGSEAYTFDENFDQVSDYRTSSVLAVPMTDQRGEVLGVLQVINAKDEEGEVIPFARSSEDMIGHFATSVALAVERAQVTRDLILRMISMAELRDPDETGAHVNRVASYAVVLFEGWGLRNGLSHSEIDGKKDMLRMAAMLHDVGKVAVSDVILKKPGRLTSKEYEIIKSHTYLGARLFNGMRSELDEVAAEVALNHHERWDGTGYPGHIDLLTGKPLPGFSGPGNRPLPKKEKEIPLFGRIVAVADVYDALSSRRSYKEPWGEERVLEEMFDNAGRQFDPELIKVFFSYIEVLRFFTNYYPDASRA